MIPCVKSMVSDPVQLHEFQNQETVTDNHANYGMHEMSIDTTQVMVRRKPVMNFVYCGHGGETNPTRSWQILT